MDKKLRASVCENKPDLRKIGLDPNFWYPLAVAKDIRKGKTLAVSFSGEQIVLVRTESNRIYALEDRCAHRQIPLSSGVVVGESLQCCYHGWTYDEHGTCLIPYLAKGTTSPCSIRKYPVRHAYGLVFVFPGDPELAEKIPLPDLPEFYSRNFVTIGFVRRVDCHYSFMHENLMDMTHQFLHRRRMGRFRPKPLEVRKGSDYVEVDYAVDLTEGSSILRILPLSTIGLQGTEAPDVGSQLQPAGSGERSMHERDFMTISTRYPYQGLSLFRPNLDEPVFKLWLAYVPVDREQKISKPCGILMIRKPKIPWIVFLLRPLFRYFADAIFEEDRVILEAEQRAYDLQGGDWNHEVLSFVVDVRELLIARGIPIEEPVRSG
jgi:phenylpropionate dioxygenase-like ring-hydroxylating dioxygenase large terminal subunit